MMGLMTGNALNSGPFMTSLRILFGRRGAKALLVGGGSRRYNPCRCGRLRVCGCRLMSRETRWSVPGALNMANGQPIRAVFTGAFDPITNGHLDIIRRAVQFCDDLIVAVGHNPEKPALFTPAERVEMIRELVEGIERVRVESYDGLTADYVRSVGAKLIIRGIRDNVDLHYELQQANINMAIGDVETVFLMTSDRYALTSSTYIKQIVELGCEDLERLNQLVPPLVAKRLSEKLGQ